MTMKINPHALILVYPGDSYDIGLVTPLTFAWQGKVEIDPAPKYQVAAFVLTREESFGGLYEPRRNDNLVSIEESDQAELPEVLIRTMVGSKTQVGVTEKITWSSKEGITSRIPWALYGRRFFEGQKVQVASGEFMGRVGTVKKTLSDSGRVVLLESSSTVEIEINVDVDALGFVDPHKSIATRLAMTC